MKAKRATPPKGTSTRPSRAERRTARSAAKAEERARRRRERVARLPAWMRDRTKLALILLSAIAVTLLAVIVPIHATTYGSPVAVTLILGAAAAATGLVALRHPAIATATFAVAALLLALTVPRDVSVDAPWPWSVPMLIAFAVAVAATTLQHGWRTGLVMYAVGTASGLTAALMLPGISSGNSLIVTTSVVGGVYLLSALLVARLRVGAELTRERAVSAGEQARRELIEERTRIARELHDVVAHSMSVIQVQASTARYRVADLSPAAIAEFEDVAGQARTALTEMRRILGVLRTQESGAALSPQRGIDDIPALVETTRRAGAEVQFTTTLTGDVSVATQLAVFRIAQEALSNALRHAPGLPVTLRLGADERCVHLDVRNPLSGDASPSPGGHGLRGMAERAAILGGTVATGQEDGRWVVAAEIPRHPDSTGQAGSP